MSECNENIRIDAYHDGELSPDEAARVENHLRQCPPCAEELRQLRQMSSVLATFESTGDVPELRPMKLAQIHRAIDAEGNVTVVRLVRQLTGIAAAVLVAGTVWLVSSSGTPQPATVAGADGVTVADWEVPALAPNATAATEMASAGREVQFAQFVVSDLSRGASK